MAKILPVGACLKSVNLVAPFRENGVEMIGALLWINCKRYTPGVPRADPLPDLTHPDDLAKLSYTELTSLREALDSITIYGDLYRDENGEPKAIDGKYFRWEGPKQMIEVDLVWEAQRRAREEAEAWQRRAWLNAVGTELDLRATGNRLLYELGKRSDLSKVYDELRVISRDHKNRLIWNRSKKKLAWLIERLYGNDHPVLFPDRERWQRASEFFVYPNEIEVQPAKLRKDAGDIRSEYEEKPGDIESLFEQI
jgi:hypothetical protein